MVKYTVFYSRCFPHVLICEGMILFPLGESIFSDLGPDGLSMFYVS